MQKTLRIFLLILIIIGIALLFNQKIWVPKLVNRILLSENTKLQTSKTLTTIPKESVKTDLIHLNTPPLHQMIIDGVKENAALKSGITGTVTLGPTCPVERIPPDPNCSPKPYPTSINITKVGNIGTVEIIKSDLNGVFSINLAPGAYSLQAKGGNFLPRCSEVLVVVKSGEYSTANISCDTGIR